MLLEEYVRHRIEKNGKHGVRTVNEKMYKLSCCKCRAEHIRTKKHYMSMKKKYKDLFTDDFCNKCWRPILANRTEYKESLSKGVQQFHKTPEATEYRENISKFHKGRIAGDKNPMKQKEVREKVSQTRTKLLKDPKERQKYVQGSIDAHTRGVYVGIDTSGRCKWYDYTHSNGNIYKVQGTWELKFIEWLDYNNIDFSCHKDRISYNDNGVIRNYYPDFFVISMGGYIDVKSTYWYKKQKKKWELLEEQHPGEIKVLTEYELRKLGIKI